MFAVIKTGGKQYSVAAEDTITVMSLAGEPGDKVTFAEVLMLVGDDETDAGAGRIGWNAPLARALRGAAIGDLRRVTLPGGEREYEVVAISYP